MTHLFDHLHEVVEVVNADEVAVAAQAGQARREQREAASDTPIAPWAEQEGAPAVAVAAAIRAACTRTRSAAIGCRAAVGSSIGVSGGCCRSGGRRGSASSACSVLQHAEEDLKQRLEHLALKPPHLRLI